MSRYASGVTVVSTVHDDLDHAMTASAFTSVSLDPPLVLVCVDKTARFHQAIAVTRRWGVSVLAEDQADVARWLATRGRKLEGQLDHIPHRPGALTGSALVEGALCWVECRTWEMYDGGDHTIVVGQVLGIELPEKERSRPLMYFRAAYGGAPDVTNGPD
ncbi:MAG: flavin reductase [Propionibacteriales bacterium]|nr:flavin reductase [Propionibacteriales bacterium]